jgi:hypothetical protein
VRGLEAHVAMPGSFTAQAGVESGPQIKTHFDADRMDGRKAQASGAFLLPGALSILRQRLTFG